MASVREIISDAYSRLGLLAVGQNLDPDRAAEGLRYYNNLINELAMEGIAPGGPAAPKAHYLGTPQNTFPPHGPDNTVTPLIDSPLTAALAGTFPFPSFFISGFKSLLALEISDGAGVEPGNLTIAKAKQCRSALLSYYIVSPVASVDQALTRMPSERLRWGAGDIINSDNED